MVNAVFLNWCAVESFKFAAKTLKHLRNYQFYFGFFQHLGVPPNFFFQISVPRAQKG
jgi:hypothetical protein